MERTKFLYPSLISFLNHIRFHKNLTALPPLSLNLIGCEYSKQRLVCFCDVRYVNFCYCFPQSVVSQIECVHDGHVGGPKQYNDFPVGNIFYFYGNIFYCFSPPTWPPYTHSIVS